MLSAMQANAGSEGAVLSAGSVVPAGDGSGRDLEFGRSRGGWKWYFSVFSDIVGMSVSLNKLGRRGRATASL